MLWPVNPLAGKTTNWRAGCGKSARPVRREGEPTLADSPYPYISFCLFFFASALSENLYSHAASATS
jgi:hypothetical protein